MPRWVAQAGCSCYRVLLPSIRGRSTEAEDGSFYTAEFPPQSISGLLVEYQRKKEDRCRRRKPLYDRMSGLDLLSSIKRRKRANAEDASSYMAESPLRLRSCKSRSRLRSMADSLVD